MPKTKIDKGRALGIMGYSNSRPLDACLGDSEKIRAVLDEALYKKTQEIHKLSTGQNQLNFRLAFIKKPTAGL